MTEQISTDLLSDIVSRAIKRGATDAEAIAIESTDFSVEVRLGEVEKLQEAASRGIGLRVLYEGRQASCSTSDVSREGIEELIANAVEMAKMTSVDEAAILPTREELAVKIADLGLHDTAIAELSAERRIEMARQAEDSARSFDPRIVNSEGGACNSRAGKITLVNSAGFAGGYTATNCNLVVAPIAKSGEQMQVGFWGDRQRQLASLDAPEAIGKEAARRALRKLGARKISTREVPVVFENVAAEDLLGDFFEAVEGGAIFRRSSFLVGQMGQQIAAPSLTIVDDGTIRGALGSRPFDGEGLATRRTVVVEDGILKSYLLDCYTARKLNLHSTANASRGLTGAPSVGPGNFFIAPGVYTPEEIIATVKEGFYVTELIGFGFNPVTGDYSRGASGLWIENGKLTFPVEEVTIAGNMKDMLKGVEMIGSDIRFRGNIAAPTIKLRQMMVSGE